MDETRVLTDLGEIRGQLSQLPAIVAQAMEPRLDKLKEEISKEVADSITHCRELHRSQLESLEKHKNNTTCVLQRMEDQQKRTGFVIGVLVLAFLGSASGGALKDMLVPFVKSLFG